MAELRELKSTFLDWEIRIILESISREADRLKNINETSQDEDEAADAGNDCIEVLMLKKRLEEEAVEVFGRQIKDFGRDAM